LIAQWYEKEMDSSDRGDRGYSFGCGDIGRGVFAWGNRQGGGGADRAERDEGGCQIEGCGGVACSLHGSSSTLLVVFTQFPTPS
jgi:hypothetical protein